MIDKVFLAILGCAAAVVCSGVWLGAQLDTISAKKKVQCGGFYGEMTDVSVRALVGGNIHLSGVNERGIEIEIWTADDCFVKEIDVVKK